MVRRRFRLALGQGEVRDARRGRGDAVERAQVTPHEPHPPDADDDQPEEHPAGDGEPRVDDGRILLGKRESDDDDRRVRRAAGDRDGSHLSHDPVGAEIRQLDGRRGWAKAPC